MKNEWNWMICICVDDFDIDCEYCNKVGMGEEE